LKLFTAIIVLFASIPPIHVSPPAPKPLFLVTAKHHGGTWYMADDGHAVYCYGPQRMIPDPLGGFMSIVTLCRGDQPIVRLKE